MKKKIIFVHTALWVGGIETSLVSVLNKLDYDKYDVTCLILSNQRELEGRIPKECKLIFADRAVAVSFKEKYKYSKLYSLFQKPQTSSRSRLLIWRILQFLLRALEERLFAKYIKENLGTNKFDVAVLFSSAICGVAVKSLAFDKCVCFYHYSDLRRVYHDSCGYDKCEKIFAVSENITERLKAFMPKYKNKLFPLHNLTDTFAIQKRSEELPEVILDNEKIKIVSCARLHRDKGFDIAAQACKLLNERGCEFNWYIIGTGPEKKSLSLLVSEMGLNNFIFLGQRINPHSIIKQADFFVQSSRIEAFGLSITESFVLGLPVISTETDGGKELVEDGKTGFLTDISAVAIADAAEKLIKSPELLKELSNNVKKLDFEAENIHIIKTLCEEFE